MAKVLQTQQDELEQLVQRLQRKLAKDVWEELEAFVDHKVEEKFDSIQDSLDNRYLLLKTDVYDRLSENAAKEQVDPKALQRRYFEIANPKDMYNDLQVAFQFDEIGVEYEEFLSKIQQETYGHLFKPLVLPPSAYQQLSLRVAKESTPTYAALAIYREEVKEHFDLVKREQSSKGFRFFTKMVAKGFGLVTLGPFGSIGAGLLVNALFDENSLIGQSMSNVENTLFSFLDELNETLDKMKEEYTYVLYALYGGCLLKVNEVLDHHHLELHSLNLLTYEFTVKFTGQEEVNFSLWAERQMYIIERKMKEEKWTEAHRMTDQFYHYVQSQPGAFPILLKNGRSVVRQSFLLKYIVISKMAEDRKQQGDWIHFVQEMFKQLPFTVRKKEVEAYRVKSPAEWGMLLVQQAIKEKDPTIFYSYLEYACQLVKRRETVWKVPKDEELEQDEIDWNIFFGFVASDLLEDKWKKEHPIQSYSKQVFYETAWLKSIRKWYKEVTKSKDTMTRYISLLIHSIQVSSFIAPIYHFMKLVWNWLRDHWKPMMKLSVSAAVIVLLLFTAYQQKDKAIAFITSFGQEEANSEVPEFIEDEYREVWTIQVEEGANVRDLASVNGDILFTLEMGSEVTWFGEKAYDEQNSMWYYIQSYYGDGWIHEQVLYPSIVASNEETGDQELTESIEQEDVVEGPTETLVEEKASEQNPHYYRLQSVDFSHSEGTYEANLEERFDIVLEKPYFLSITEDVSGTIMVRSQENLPRKPEKVWASNIVGETYQLVAVSYEEAGNGIDVFLINPYGEVVSVMNFLTSNFNEHEAGFIYLDANTGKKRLITIESDQLIDRVISIESGADSGNVEKELLDYLRWNVENSGDSWEIYYSPEQSGTGVEAYHVYSLPNNQSPIGIIYMNHETGEITFLPW